MHRVELKVRSRKREAPEVVKCVPNAPCGVESIY